MGMNKYDRLLYILNLLRSRRNLNASALAKECGVTERSIYRDIIALSEANIPIYYDNGYKLASDNFLPALNFDFDEYRCLSLALESTPLNIAAGQKEILSRVKAKIEGALADSVRKKDRFTPRTTRVEISSSIDNDVVEVLYDQLETAVSGCQRIRMNYDSIKSGLIKREVDPYFIVFKGHAFYFVGFCHLRNEFRTFRIDRVKELELLDERFVRKDGIDAQSYFDGSWRVYGGELVEIVVKFSGSAAKVISGARHNANEVITELGKGDIEYRVTTRGLDEIERWIIGFGTEAEVAEPEELRQRLSALGEGLSRKYNQ